eukprot:7390193-Prymnesium_polylepis.1
MHRASPIEEEKSSDSRLKPSQDDEELLAPLRRNRWLAKLDDTVQRFGGYGELSMRLLVLGSLVLTVVVLSQVASQDGGGSNASPATPTPGGGTGGGGPGAKGKGGGGNGTSQGPPDLQNATALEEWCLTRPNNRYCTPPNNGGRGGDERDRRSILLSVGAVVSAILILAL